VRIELAPHGSEPPLEPRFMLFRPTDPEPERWQSIGLVVAALALYRDEAEEAKAGAQGALEPLEPAHAGDSTAPVWLGLGAEVGSGLDSGGPRLGARLEAGLRPHALRPAFAAITAGMAGQSTDGAGLSARFVQLGAAIGLTASVPALDLDFRFGVGPTAEGLTVFAERSDGTTHAATRWLLGGRAGAGAVWPSSGPVGGFLAGSAWHLTGATGVRVDGAPIARAPAAGLAGQAGIEIRLNP
jgi:hypothetical protein